jgi:LuxR family maltose regulon positive regulatory protein
VSPDGAQVPRPWRSPRFVVPAASPTDVRRQRLFAVLSDDPAPVTLVSGPAGSGKSSLLATWAATRGDEVVAWLGLEPYDDHPGQLWTSVLEALRSTGCFHPDAPLHQLAAPPGEVTPSFVDRVVAEVAALDRPVWLVLDDVHLLRREAALASIGLLIRRSPDVLRLVLASRAEPKVGLPRLRVDGQLREVSAKDLAFTLDETATFLQLQGLELPRSPLELLHRRTEGWIAGLRIAAMALAADPDPGELVESFSGSDHALADYFLTEVVQALPQQRRDFLVATSTCSNLTVGLARRLSGRDDAGAVLDELVRDNVFVRRLGRGRRHFRYHELLRSYFTAELEQHRPDVARELHGVAASWHADVGDALHAMEHLARAGDTQRLSAFADEHGLPAVHRGRAQRLARLLATLGPAHRALPGLALIGAAAAMEADRLDDADRWLAPLRLDELTAGPDARLASLAAAVSVARARYTTRVDVQLERLEATGATASVDPDHELYVRYHRGVARLYVGRYDDAISDLERATTIARVAEYSAMELSCVSFLAGTLVSRNDWHEARCHADRAVALAERRGWARSPPVSHLYMIVGWSAYLQGDTAGAAANAASAVASLGHHVDPGVELATRTLKAVVAAHGPTPFAALRAYRPVFQRLHRAQTSPALLAASGPVLVEIALDVGERTWAREFAEELIDLAPDAGGPALLRALLLVDAGHLDRAARELQPVLEVATAWHVVTAEVRARVLAAEIELRRGDDRRALEHVRAGLSEAEPIRFVRGFLGRPGVMQLLRTAQGRFGRSESFVQGILAAASGPERDPVARNVRLTPSELELLRELPAPLSLQQLADAHAVSLNTVKTHLQAVYRKLDVHSRREAVIVGRRRGLL